MDGGSQANLIRLHPYQFQIRGTLNERICLPGLAVTRADGMRRFRLGNWLQLE